MRNFVIFVCVAACGGGTVTTTTGGGGGTTPPGTGGGAGAGVVVKVDFEAESLPGLVYLPEALDKPLMPGGDKVVARSIADQRKRWQRAKGPAKALEGEALALLLWFKPGRDGEVDEEQRAEATRILREIAKLGESSESMVHALAVAEQTAGQRDAALAAWKDLAARFPESRARSVYLAMIEYAALRAGAAKAELTKFPEGDAAPPEALYVNAWQYFVMGRPAEAAAAITRAAGAWPNVETLPQLRRDVMLFMARGGQPVPRSFPLLDELARRDNGDVDRIETGMVMAYFGGGEYQLAADGAKVVAERSGDPNAYLLLADALVRLERPADAADAAIAAHKAALIKKDGIPETAGAVAGLAVRFHGDFAHSLDPAFGQAARALYDYYATIPDREDAAKMAEQAAELTKHLAGASSRTLDKEIIRRHVNLRTEQAVACYERSLQAAHDLAGTVALKLTVTSAGTVTSASADGLGAVSSCLAERARAWTFPRSAGTTEITYPYAFAPEK